MPYLDHIKVDTALNNSSFQSDSKKSGDAFEDIVMSELNATSVLKNVYIPEAGVEVDFVADGRFIEAKGGNDGDKKRPGAKRTDSVKKAIANGALIKAVNPDSHYTVYFSSRPKVGSSSDVMLRVALEHKIIDEIIYLVQEPEQYDLFGQLFDTIDETEKAGNDR